MTSRLGAVPAGPQSYLDRPAPEPKRAPRTMKDLGIKPATGDGAKANTGFRNIVKVLNEATPEEREYWGRWYPNASAVVRQMAEKYQLPFETVAGVVAVMSPGNRWHQNVEVARQVILWWKAQQSVGPNALPQYTRVGPPVRDDAEDEGAEVLTPDFARQDESEDPSEEQDEQQRSAQLGRPYVFEPVKNQPEGVPATVFREKKPRTYPLGQHGPTPAGYPANVDKAIAILNGADPMSLMQTSPKVSVFYKSLVDPESVQNELVLDGHAINIWRGQKRTLKGLESPTVEERERMLADYQKAADRAGLPVQAVQAITWYIWRWVTDFDNVDNSEQDNQANSGLRSSGRRRGLRDDESLEMDCQRTAERQAQRVREEGRVSERSEREATVHLHAQTDNQCSTGRRGGPHQRQQLGQPEMQSSFVEQKPEQSKWTRSSERIGVARSKSPAKEELGGRLAGDDYGEQQEDLLGDVQKSGGRSYSLQLRSREVLGRVRKVQSSPIIETENVEDGTKTAAADLNTFGALPVGARFILLADAAAGVCKKTSETTAVSIARQQEADIPPTARVLAVGAPKTASDSQPTYEDHLPADQLPGGAADDVPESDFDPAELEEGTKHELEHTDDEALAGEIARDHLVEDPQYYEKLKKVEAKSVRRLHASSDDDLMDVLIEAGPPDEWSGGVVSALGDKRQEVEALWESLSAAEQAEVSAKFRAKFDADWAAEFGEPREAQARQVLEEPSTPPPWLEGAQRVTKEDAKIMLPMDGSVWLTNDGPWYYVPALPLSAVPRVKPWSSAKAQEYADLDLAELPPIVLEAKPANDGSDSWRYEIVDGEHRTYAARLAKLTTIPAYVGFPVEYQPRRHQASLRQADFIEPVPAAALMPKALEAADALIKWARGDKYAQDDADASISEAVAATPAARKIDPGTPNSPLAWFMPQPGAGDVDITGGQMLLGAGIPKFNIPPGPTGIVVYVDKAGVQKSDRQAIAKRIVEVLQHELIHVEQFSRSQGKLRKDDISTNSERYYERPHEIEAYAHGIVQELLRSNPDTDFRSTDQLHGSVDYIRFAMRYGKYAPNPNPDVMNRLHRLIFEYAQAAKAARAPKQAAQDIRTAAFGNKNYWVDPDGQTYESAHSHDAWALGNRGKTANNLLDEGWVRVAPPDAVQVRALTPQVGSTVRSVVTSLLRDYPDRAGVWVETDEDNIFVPRTPTGRPDFSALLGGGARTAGRVWGYLREGDIAGRAPGIFLRIPEPLAGQFPQTRGDDESPPHFTLAYVLGRRTSDSDKTIVRGKSTDENPNLPPLNDQDRSDMVAAVSAALNGADGFAPFELTLGEGVEWFENGKGAQIAHKEPEKGSEGAAKLEQLATRIRDALGAEGFVVSHADKPFLAHSTLAYLPTREYTGAVPEGSFTVDHVELWGWPETWIFDLEGAHQQSKAAAPTRLKPRTEYDHVCPHCDEIIYEKHVVALPPDYKSMKHRDCGGIIEWSKEARAYHGTPGGFRVFEHDRSGLGTHFGTERAAEQRGQDLSRIKNFDSWEVREYELSVSNPLRLPDVVDWNQPLTVASALAEAGILDELSVDSYDPRLRQKTRAQIWSELRAKIQSSGYDAVVYENTQEDRGNDSWIVWDNAKLKWLDVPEDRHTESRVTAAPSTAAVGAARWAGAYPRFQRNAHGEYEEEQGSGVGNAAHPHADGAIPGVNEQVTNAPGSQYAELAKNWGTLTPGTNSDLRFYDYRPYAKQVDDLVRDHGYDVYYAGGKYGKPDLANRNYQTGHLMIYDPTPGSGGDFGDEEYTRTWRTIHELSHAKSLEELNAKYGEGRRIGKLGWQRTPREAKRAVEWEWLAAHKQRELGEQMGYFIDDATFAREINTVLHDAVHRAITGQFTNPDQEGFVPSDRIVPLEVALAKIDEAAQALGLESDDALLTPEQRQQLKQRTAAEADAAPLTLYAVVSGDALIAASEDDDFAVLQREAEAHDPRAPWTVYQLDDVPVDLARKLLSVTSGVGFGASLDPQRALVEAQPYIGSAVAERAMARRALKKWKQDRRRRRRLVNQVWYRDAQGFLRPTLSAAGDQRADRAAVDAGPQAVALPTNLKIQSLSEAELAARALELLHETLSEEARAAGFEAIRVGDRMLLVSDVPSEPVGHLSPYTDLSDEGDGTDQ